MSGFFIVLLGTVLCSHPNLLDAATVGCSGCNGDYSKHGDYSVEQIVGYSEPLGRDKRDYSAQVQYSDQYSADQPSDYSGPLQRVKRQHLWQGNFRCSPTSCQAFGCHSGDCEQWCKKCGASGSLQGNFSQHSQRTLSSPIYTEKVFNTV